MITFYKSAGRVRFIREGISPEDVRARARSIENCFKRDLFCKNFADLAPLFDAILLLVRMVAGRIIPSQRNLRKLMGVLDFLEVTCGVVLSWDEELRRKQDPPAWPFINFCQSYRYYLEEDLREVFEWAHRHLHQEEVDPLDFILPLIVLALTTAFFLLFKLPPWVIRPAVATAVGALLPSIRQLLAEGKTIEEIIEEIRGEPQIERLEGAFERISHLCPLVSEALSELERIRAEGERALIDPACAKAEEALLAVEEALLVEGVQIAVEDLPCASQIEGLRALYQEVCLL